MKKWWYILFLTLSLTRSGSIFSQYLGGNTDGYSKATLTQLSCPSTFTNIYLGGNTDGYSRANLINLSCTPGYSNISKGGSADGYSGANLINLSCAPVYSNIHKGGTAGGYSKNLVSCVATLPIEIANFDAACLPATSGRANKTVELKWSTLTETNNNFFTIERMQGANFEPIGKVYGAGNSQKKINYNFYDQSLMADYSLPVYYRLKQTDYNGKYEYFKIVSVTCNGNFSKINIYPNPTTGKCIIQCGGENNKVEIFNAAGKKIIGQYLSGGSTEIDLSGEENGVYFVRVDTIFEQKNFRLILCK